MIRLREAAVTAKCELSSLAQTKIILFDSTGPMNMHIKLSRSKLEQITTDLARRTIVICKEAMHDEGVKPSDIHNVFLLKA